MDKSALSKFKRIPLTERLKALSQKPVLLLVTLFISSLLLRGFFISPKSSDSTNKALFSDRDSRAMESLEPLRYVSIHGITLS